MSKLSEGDDVFSGGADLPLVELVLERLHDGGGVADRVNQDDAQTPGKEQQGFSYAEAALALGISKHSS